MTGKAKIFIGCLAAASAALLVLTAALILLAAPLAIWLCRQAPPKDLSEGALPLSFKSSDAGLQKEFAQLCKEKALPKQAGAREGASKAWRELEAFLESKEIAELVDAHDKFIEEASKEPRYAEGLDIRSTQAQTASYLAYLKFSAETLQPFKSDAPFAKADAFIGSLPKAFAPSDDSDGENDAEELKELLKLKTLLCLSEGRRLEALKTLDILFKLAKSPLMPGFDGAYCRHDAAACALAAVRSGGSWSEKELKELQRIADRERRAPDFAETIATERRNALDFYERERAKGGRAAKAWKVLAAIPGNFKESGLSEISFALDDLKYELLRDVDKEELDELSLLRAMASKDFIAESERERFLEAARPSGDFSKAEEDSVHCLITVQSETAACLGALDAALRLALGLPQDKARLNPMTGRQFKAERRGGNCVAETWEDGPEPLEIAPARAPSGLK